MPRYLRIQAPVHLCADVAIPDHIPASEVETYARKRLMEQLGDVEDEKGVGVTLWASPGVANTHLYPNEETAAGMTTLPAGFKHTERELV